MGFESKEGTESEGDDDNAESLDEESEVDDGDQDGESESDAQEVKTHTGGTRLRMYYDEERDDLATFKIMGQSKSRQTSIWLMELCEFMNHLQDKVINHIPWKELQVYTEHQRDDVKWRGHPNYRGSGCLWIGVKRVWFLVVFGVS